MKRVLVLSPHPDDEAIGCGGTLRKHALEGDTVRVIFLTSGEQGGHGMDREDTVRIRELESEEACQVLGLSAIEFWREPDGGMRSGGPVVGRLTEMLRRWKPHVIYLPHDREMHADHRATARLARASLKALAAANEKLPDSVLMYEVWTPLGRMDEIVDISPYVEVKRSAIRAYRSQCAVMDLDDAILGLNRYRGEMFSWPEGEYAEVFTSMEVPCRR